MPGSGERENGKLVYNGYNVSVTQGEYVLEICHATSYLYLTILHCVLKILRVDPLSVFAPLKKKKRKLLL